MGDYVTLSLWSNFETKMFQFLNAGVKRFIGLLMNVWNVFRARLVLSIVKLGHHKTNLGYFSTPKT